jgi:hypothetical protein
MLIHLLSHLSFYRIPISGVVPNTDDVDINTGQVTVIREEYLDLKALSATEEVVGAEYYMNTSEKKIEKQSDYYMNTSEKKIGKQSDDYMNNNK